jgi:environmental stress-induced protein Ves
MRLIREADQIRMPWKNGGGETIEIARWPDQSSLYTFDWRISRARVDGDGAFSRFEGIDRTLTVLDGDGIALSFEGRAEICLTRQSEPFRFDGGLAASSRLLAGAIVDLNVMTRRGSCDHRVERLTPAPQIPVSGHRGCVVLVLSTGVAAIEMAQMRDRLGANDVLQLAPNDTATIRTQPSCRLYLIEIRSL